MNYFKAINSQLDALKAKDIEKNFYEILKGEGKILPKVIPFKGINTDMLYIKNNKILFMKFMNTTDDLFSILGEEIVEVMNEEYELLKIRMQQYYQDINYEYIYILPYVDIDYDEWENEFVSSKMLDRGLYERLVNRDDTIDLYMNEENNEIKLNIFLFDICSEYYIPGSSIHLNKDFKKISFFNNEYEYTASMMENEQIVVSDSIKYGTTIFNGGSGTGKTSIMLSRVLKLSKIYPHHRFLILVDSKQSANEMREKIELLSRDSSNIDVHTFSSFVFRLAKVYNLVFDYGMLKKDYEKTFGNLIKQARNVIKNKRMFKGIFIDEAENFSEEQIKFIEEFLYKTKHIFNIFNCKGMNLTNNLNIFHNRYENIHIDHIKTLKKNYRQSKELVELSNRFGRNADNYYKSLRPNLKNNVFVETKHIRAISSKGNANIINVSDLDDQISSVIWEIEYLINKKGLSYKDIAVVYPFNKKRLKSGKTIYFQYMLKKALEEAGIDFIMSDENLTSMSPKNGVTISNIYSIRGLEFKAVILCELEMLYNQKIADPEQDYQINDFAGDINKVYYAINKAREYVSFVTTFNSESSDIIRIINESVES